MRNPTAVFFTNVRFFLILLVVLVNLLLTLPPLPEAAQAIVTAIFTFHLPVFVLVTGYFAKKYWQTPEAAAGMLRIALQYLFFQTLYSVLDLFWLHSPGIRYSFWLPYWMLWFLTAHFGWKLLLIPFARLKHPVAAAVLLGAAAGFLPAEAGAWLGLTRTLVFFPFFLAGYYWREEREPRRRTAPQRRAIRAAAALLLLALPAFWHAAGADTAAQWLAGGGSYAQLGVPAAAGTMLRLGCYAAQAAASAAFLLLLPRAESRLTVLGGRTVYVFLLHGAAIKLLGAAGLLQLLARLMDAGAAGAAAALAAGCAAAAAIVAALSTRWFAAVMRPCIEPDAARALRWLQRRLPGRARSTY
ncbi:acyltransferase family protein [Paenibacillus sp. HGH0039]|uniref:acyltransferase family protein n=1 Tax=Paenibacillus sp. HGH0039 TaxID=1078505 RepID=UPI0003155798|nr:acyltransferase family protein [Paenibacillus sp. HGH0039]EPD81108.1 hypothetical protein HMPREF1207_04865 [Paenibacillus sp. HGH0039]